MQAKPIITLTTDFGYSDPLAGIMKGVIAGINPEARIVDITHGIGAYSIKEAALVIGMSYKHFPPKTIHVVVIDPGVGSERRPILVETDNYYFVGPDNGVFSFVYNENKDCSVLHLTADHYFLRRRSATFHGRDIFAPVAAWLSTGVSASKFGESITDYSRLSLPFPSMTTNTTLAGEVIYVDHFGNAITNISIAEIDMLRSANPNRALKITLKDRHIPFVRYYREAGNKGLYALIDSMDYLEIFVYMGDAASEFDIKVGDAVRVDMS